MLEVLRSTGLPLDFDHLPFQAFIMESDESMYYKEGDVHCTVRSSGLCEDLGQARRDVLGLKGFGL